MNTPKLDLINAPPPPKRKVIVDCWLIIFDDGSVGGVYNTKPEALTRAVRLGHIAVIHVRREVEEGEGL